MRKLIYLALSMLLTFCSAFAQKPADTASIIRKFNQIMAFAVQPYLHYNSVLSMRTRPMTDTAKETTVLHAEFYKVNDDLYYGNEQEELYLQDSLMIRINHSRKMIQLNKVDVATKKKMDILPLKNASMQKMLREHCTISQLEGKEDIGHIVITSPEKLTAQGAAGSEMVVAYRLGSYLPVLMEIDLHVRNDATAEMVDMLRGQGFDVEKMEGEKDGKKSLAMTQTASVSFGEIEVTKEKAVQMPSWKTEVDYDGNSGIYSGKGRCEGYEIIRTF